MHRSVAKIVFWLHGHIPRAYNIHVMYNFEHHGSWVTAERGVCVVIADVCHTVKNIHFSTSVQKLLTLLFSPFTQTWFTICPSKKCISHSEINNFFFNPFCPLSLHTFWHLVIYVYILSHMCIYWLICVYIVYCSIQCPEIWTTWIINDITHTPNVTTITPHPPHLHTCTD